MFDRNRKVSGESSKSYKTRFDTGFLHRYLGGTQIIEIGGTGNGVGFPIVEGATNVDIGFPGYDGLYLPFATESQDAVYSSHCLEHVDDWMTLLREWFRVIKRGGFLVIVVPHQLLYEKKTLLPSRFAGAGPFGHKRFYLPSTLLNEVQLALPISEWRLRHCQENDIDFDYDLAPWEHSTGCYDIELVLQKVAPYKYLRELLNDGNPL